MAVRKTFTATEVLTAANTNLYLYNRPDVTSSTATAYTATTSDVNKTLQFTSASAVTLTISTATALVAGEVFNVLRDGAGGGDSGGGSFDLISTTLLTGSQASVTFDVTGLGSTYKHLQIRVVSRISTGNGMGDIYMTLNSDTGSNYSAHNLYGNGSNVQSNAYTSTPFSQITGTSPYNNQATNSYGASIIDMLDAFSTSKYKTFKTLAGVHGSTDNQIKLNSMSWRSTSAITTINLAPYSGFSWASGSRFSIYGIKA